MSECAWFKCRRRFEPIRHTERFCTKKCQGNEKNWRMMRGAPLVRLLLVWREARGWTRDQRAAWAEEHSRPVPSLADAARLVDAMVAEQRDYKP